MDLSYNAVASKCADQMSKYQNCVMAHQNGDWNTLCAAEGKALTECADNSVPHLKELKNKCANDIMSYRKCLDENGSLSEEEVGARCGQVMKKVWECTESVMRDIEKKSGDSSGASPTAETKGSEKGGAGRIV